MMMDNESIKRQIQRKIEVLKKKTDVVSSKNSDKLLNSLRSEIETKSKNLQEMKRMIEIQSRNLNELIEKVDHLTSNENEESVAQTIFSETKGQIEKIQKIKNLSRKEFLRFMNNTPISKMTPQQVKSADRMLVGFANMLNREEVRGLNHIAQILRTTLYHSLISSNITKTLTPTLEHRYERFFADSPMTDSSIVLSHF